MGKDESILTYLSRLAEVRGELGGVKEIVPSSYMLRISLLGLPKSCHSFQDVVNGIDKLPDWERLWLNLV